MLEVDHSVTAPVYVRITHDALRPELIARRLPIVASVVKVHKGICRLVSVIQLPVAVEEVEVGRRIIFCVVWSAAPILGSVVNSIVDSLCVSRDSDGLPLLSCTTAGALLEAKVTCGEWQFNIAGRIVEGLPSFRSERVLEVPTIIEVASSVLVSVVKLPVTSAPLANFEVVEMGSLVVGEVWEAIPVLCRVVVAIVEVVRVPRDRECRPARLSIDNDLFFFLDCCCFDLNADLVAGGPAIAGAAQLLKRLSTSKVATTVVVSKSNHFLVSVIELPVAAVEIVEVVLAIDEVGLSIPVVSSHIRSVVAGLAVTADVDYVPSCVLWSWWHVGLRLKDVTSVGINRPATRGAASFPLIHELTRLLSICMQLVCLFLLISQRQVKW